MSCNIPASLLRQQPAAIEAPGELQTVRHFTQLSKKNFCIDSHFYPLGSCTMKYNPRAAHRLASLGGFLRQHPLTPDVNNQGYLQCLHELQETLLQVTGMTDISLSPMAGAQGEFAGVAMIKAYHQARQDHARTEILVPDAAHGTNPASAVMCGYISREIPTTADGDLDLNALKAALGPQTAGIMLTNPSTLGVFERQIQTIATLVHEAGGLLYYDGANLNAILGNYRPGDMGFDVMHLNLHKTFATPHGGGGPGAGPVACNKKVAAYLPTPIVVHTEQGYRLHDQAQRPESIGRLSTFAGNSGVLLRAYVYTRLLGREGMPRVGLYAKLNANYLMRQLEAIGYTLAFPERHATHEFIITLKPLTKRTGVTATDVAKRLLDYGFHAPTVYFPLLIPECLLIEPTETENKTELDRFIHAMRCIYSEIITAPQRCQQAPHNQPVGRLNEVKAAKELVVS